MRTFRLQILDPFTQDSKGTDGGDVVIDYPISNMWIHNGFGGGTDTPAPNKAETREIIKLLKGLLAELRTRKEVEVPKE